MASGEGSLKSKKFIGFLVSEVSWKVIIVIIMIAGMRWDKVDPWIAGVTLTVVLIAGFVEVTYLGGQAALDKYVHLAQIAVAKGETPQQLASELEVKKDGKID